jgi:uncharacterized protein (UPF0332 family)
MAFAEDLLKQAFLLLNKESKNPTQASLRRSVSTAYYALFHLLIHDASANGAEQTHATILRVHSSTEP